MGDASFGEGNGVNGSFGEGKGVNGSFGEGVNGNDGIPTKTSMEVELEGLALLQGEMDAMQLLTFMIRGELCVDMTCSSGADKWMSMCNICWAMLSTVVVSLSLSLS